MARLLIVVFVLSLTACGSSGDEGYACYGNNGASDHCWESPGESNEQGCLDQGRTWNEGSCPDNGYSVNCGSYFVRPSGACI